MASVGGLMLLLRRWGHNRRRPDFFFYLCPNTPHATQTGVTSTSTSSSNVLIWTTKIPV